MDCFNSSRSDLSFIKFNSQALSLLSKLYDEIFCSFIFIELVTTVSQTHFVSSWIHFLVRQSLCLFIISILFVTGLIETDPEGALDRFSEVVQMEAEKAEWWVLKCHALIIDNDLKIGRKLNLFCNSFTLSDAIFSSSDIHCFESTSYRFHSKE